MPRRPRIIIPGYPYHIILRGNNKSDIFYNDKDRRFFIDCLKISKEKTNSKIYAYCLMTNHAHFIVEPSKDSGLSEMIQSLGRRYVQYININHHRTGTLWEGRYKSSLIDRDEYLMACSRYVELNPVRAGMVKRPDEYRWSSYRSKISDRSEDFIDFDSIYLSLGRTDIEKRYNYARWVFESVPDRELELIRLATKKCGIIGSSSFANRIEKITGRSFALRPRGRPKKSL